MNSRWRYTIIGSVLAIAGPILWALLLRLAADLSLTPFLYIGLVTATLVGFGLIGYFVGLRQDRLDEVADRDQLTGLFNQNAFYRVSEILLALSLRERSHISILMLDLDHFKEVNDQGGHVLGSFVLKEIGKIIRSELRNSDVAAKFGGDEFIVCLPRCNAEQAKIPAERIRKLIKTTVFKRKDQEVRVTCSIGISQNDFEDGNNILRTIESADAALYDAKHAGRDQIKVANEKTPELKKELTTDDLKTPQKAA